MSGFRVRPVRRDELPQLLELYGQLHAREGPPPEERLGTAWESILGHPGLTVFVAEVEGKVVSTCTLAILPNLTRGGSPYALVENVVTLEYHRKQGLGTEVLKAAFQKA